jgi:hypothetical protein
VCSICTELSPTRHWSVRRHIQRKHNDVGEPISINTYQTRDQMRMASRVPDLYVTPSGDLTQSNYRTDTFGDLHEYNRTMPFPQKFEYGALWMPKLQEMLSLFQQLHYPPQLVSNILGGLSLSLHYLDNAQWESIIDVIINGLRNDKPNTF